MRVTVHIPERMNDEIKKSAEREKKSVSSFVSGAVEFYITEKKRKELGKKVLALAGRVRISKDVLKELDEGRAEHGRP